jgi:hypothetical protein
MGNEIIQPEQIKYSAVLSAGPKPIDREGKKTPS